MCYKQQLCRLLSIVIKLQWGINEWRNGYAFKCGTDVVPEPDIVEITLLLRSMRVNDMFHPCIYGYCENWTGYTAFLTFSVMFWMQPMYLHVFFLEKEETTFKKFRRICTKNKVSDSHLAMLLLDPREIVPFAQMFILELPSKWSRWCHGEKVAGLQLIELQCIMFRIIINVILIN